MKLSPYQSKQIKALLREAGVVYNDVARDAGVS